MQDYDVIVAGGGPAGLLLASKLSSRARVVVLERGKLGATSKYWVTTTRRLLTHSLQECIRFKTDTITVGTFLGQKAIGKGDLAVVDEHTLLQELSRRCRESGVSIREDSELTSLSWGTSTLSAVTQTDHFTCRLLVDATGGGSPIASTFQLHQLDGFFSVYGAYLEGISNHTSDIVLADVLRLGHPPPLFEFIPAGAHSAYACLFVTTKRLMNPKELKSAFDSHVRNNPYFSIPNGDYVTSGKMGIIPIGRLKRRFLPGLLPHGEAAMLQPPLLGTAFNEVLEHSSFIADSILEQMKSAKSGIPLVRIRHPILKRANDSLQRLIAKKLISGNVEVVDRVIRGISTLSPKLVFRLYSNELTWRDFPRLAPVLPKLV